MTSAMDAQSPQPEPNMDSDRLRHALRSTNPDERRQALWSVVDQADGPPPIEVLLDNIQHPDTEVRGRVAWALGHFANPSTIPALLSLLDDPDPGVRHDAALALVQNFDRSLLEERLVGAFRKLNRAIQDELFWALELISIDSTQL